MTREEAEAVIKAAVKIGDLVEEIPHKIARKILDATKEITEIVGYDAFPGGYYGCCIMCEEPKGQDEMHSCGDEDVCGDCLERWQKDEQARAKA